MSLQKHRWRAAGIAGGAIVVACAGFLAGPSFGHQADNGTLEAVVGTNDGFDIGLFFPDGQRVGVLPPGTYTVVVHDRSAIHNFHLASNFDSSVDFRTDVPFVGDQTFTVTFKPATRYAYACEPHWQVMNGSFFVLAQATTTTATTTTIPAVRTKVRASVSASGKVTLQPSRVSAGAVQLVVRDISKRFNFHLVGPGVNRRTTAGFTGTVAWNLRLRAGVYRFGSDPQQLRGTLRVTTP